MFSLPRLRPTRFRRGTALLAAGLGLAAVASACSPAPSSSLGTTGPLSGPYAKNVFGIDVASYQHPNGAGINWGSVKASGAAFAFVKMSEGNYYTNPYAASDIAGARAVGLRASAYHFGRPRLPMSSATSDAQWFATQVGNVRAAGALPPVLDIEATTLNAADTTTWTRNFLSALEAATGRTPMIYTGSWFWRGYMGNPTGFSRYPIWISQYTSAATSPNLFGDWSYSTVWQYTDSARVNGVSGGVDGNYFHGTRSQLDSFAYVGSAPTSTAPPAGSLSLTAAATVPAGHPLWIYGYLTDTRTNTPLVNKTFSVWRKVAGQSSYTQVAAGQTTGDGVAFWATSQTRTTSYQFRVAPGAAGSGFPAINSPVVTVGT